MAFKNKIRLPFYITRPQFPSERNADTLADGTARTLSVVVRKVYEGETDYLPEKWHERLKIALIHDIITLETDRYLGDVILDSDYEIQWQTFLDYPIAKAQFKVQVTPFNYSNANCQSCEEATQLNVVDDYFESAYGVPLPLAEETQYQKSVIANDEICCFPVVYSIIYFDPVYLSSATIDTSGLLTINTNDDLVSINNLKLVTYRVTCPNGSYDEGDVYGDVVGSIAGCLSPVTMGMDVIGITEASANWVAPSPAPSGGYVWELYLASNPGSPVQTGSTGSLFVNLTGLDPSTEYVLHVRSECGAVDSNFVTDTFITLGESAICGKYRVEYDDGTNDRGGYTDVTYLNCDSDYQTIRIYNMQARVVCALQNGPGDPVEIIGGTDVTYLEEC